MAPDRLLVRTRCRAAAGQCPDCGRRSEQVHSRYERRLLDLPSHGRAVQMRVTVRRFRCAEPDCRRRIFAERLGDAVAGRSARLTSRLELIIRHLGIALGGRPAAALARRLMLPASRDTLLRVVRGQVLQDRRPIHVIGIDDWAWKRGQRYGSIICDERRRIIDLLPDREPVTIEGWLARHPEVRVISRDRGGGYGQAATRAAPQAVQIADRWHLMENASAALLEAVRRSMRPVRVALGSTVIDPALLTHAERLQRGLPAAGGSLRHNSHACPGRHADQGDCASHRPQSQTGARDRARWWRRRIPIPIEFARTPSRLARCRMGRRLPQRRRAVAASTAIGFPLTGRHRMGNAAAPGQQRRIGEAAQAPVRPGSEPLAVERSRSADEGRGDHPRAHRERRPGPSVGPRSRRPLPPDGARPRSGRPAGLDPRGRHPRFLWQRHRRRSSRGHCSSDEPWSNGQTEGQITKLKLVKRQMYGRAKLDLLRARLTAPA
jgi:hypothetical protein